MAEIVDLRPHPYAPDADQPPCNIEAEQALLGVMLYDNAAYRSVNSVLQARHFYEPFHGRLFTAIETHVKRGHLAEPILMAEQFQADPAFAELGGVRYLADLVDRSPMVADAPHYARVIHDLSLRRDLMRVGGEIVSAARDDAATPVSDQLTTAHHAIVGLSHGLGLDDLAAMDAQSSSLASLDEIDVEADSGRAKGMMTGLRCFDTRLRGLRPGHLIVLAGRPSMGKTALARQAAFNAARRQPHSQVAFFALEMERRELDERTLSCLSFEDGGMTPVAYKDIHGGLDFFTRRKLRELALFVPRNLIVIDRPVLTVDYVERAVWDLKRQGEVGAVFVDYLQIMDRPVQDRSRNDAAIIGDMTKALKQLAREAETCVVLLSQINRGVESRDDKRPQLADLRDSGSIEQDANAVLFPYREVYYVERAEPPEGSAKHSEWEINVENLRQRMDVICAKNRGGAIGFDRMEYQAAYDRIVNGWQDR